MISNRKFLVSKDLYLTEFSRSGPTTLNRLIVATLLTTGKNVYVFDDLIQAQHFANTRGAAQPEKYPMTMFTFFATEFPIFEVELEHLVTEPKLHKKPKNYSHVVTEYISGGKVRQTLTADTTYQIAKELYLQQSNILAVHSGSDCNFALGELKSSHESACRLM